MKSSEVGNEFLRELGTHKNAAKILQFLVVIPEAASSTIETKTQTRQTDVSKALLWMRSKEWINSRNGPDPISGYKKTLYSLPDHIKMRVLSLSEEEREILNLVASGHMGKENTRETRDKIAVAHLGKPRDPEVMKRLHASVRGRKRTPEERKRIGDGNRGKTRSTTLRAQISATLKGRPGRKHTPESRAKLSASRSSPAARAQLKSLHDNHCGENSHFWKNGASFGKYCPRFNKRLKNDVRKFFGEKCVICHRTKEENWNAALSVHHVFVEKMACCETKIEEMNAVRRRLPKSVARFDLPEFTPEEITYIRMLAPLCKKCHGIVEGELLDIPYEETKYRKLLAEIIMNEYGGRCFP